eukprot:3611202-Amphidinium_carterae.1
MGKMDVAEDSELQSDFDYLFSRLKEFPEFKDCAEEQFDKTKSELEDDLSKLDELERHEFDTGATEATMKKIATDRDLAIQKKIFRCEEAKQLFVRA